MIMSVGGDPARIGTLETSPTGHSPRTCASSGHVHAETCRDLSNIPYSTKILVKFKDIGVN